MADQSQISPLKQAYFAIEKLQARIKALEAVQQAPIAIVGMGCRFPGGANSPAAFWEMLQQGEDAISEFPKSRFDIDAYYDSDPDAPGKIATRWGAFLEDVDRFEPQFFGISPREAVSMDPQQRLLLEVAWEALENAGIAPDSLYNSPTGVYVGASATDYAQVQQAAAGIEHIDPYYSSGVASSVISGRLSYVLGLQGPSLSVDTACSSSLVAVHLAVQALRTGDCRLALAGGVYLVLSPENTVALSRYHMLAPDGRCKAFDAAADGFGQGEGCGVVVLKRLIDALADGDTVLGVIRGSAVNQDGPSSGLTSPNGPSQEAVIRAALADAGVQAADVGYVETHGTGTSLGDPIEVNALGAVFAGERATPLQIGSVKANIGHTVSAAGVAGLIKTVLSLQAGRIPPLLNLTQLSDHIPWGDYPISVPVVLTDWPAINGNRLAGVSAFGFSGTNAHVIIEAGPVSEGLMPELDRPLHVVTLSAQTPSALRTLAAGHAHYLQANAVDLADFAYTLNAGRSSLPERFAFIAEDAEHAVIELTNFADQGSGLSGRAPVDRPKLAFLFTGQGSQYAGMGQELYATAPEFKAAFDACAALMDPLLGQSLAELVFVEESSHLLDETAYTQPALFALEYALARLWQSWGVTPDWVLGHSVGEYVAAVIAGVFSLEDGARLIVARGRLMGALPTGGGMAAIFTDEATVNRFITNYADRASVAAVNAPEEVVISGEEAALEALISRFEAQGIRCKRLRVSHAFHSPLMEPILAEFAQVAQSCTFHRPQIKLVSNVTGGLIGAEIATPEYWIRHIRAAVRFGESVQLLAESGCQVFLEVGPAPILTGLGQRNLEADVPALWLHSLQAGRWNWLSMLRSVMQLWVAGVPVGWQGFDQPYPRRKVQAPTYPFERQRYWVKTVQHRPAKTLNTVDHPLLGRRIGSPLAQIQFEGTLSTETHAFLNDHRLFDLIVLPGTAYIETALAAGQAVFNGEAFAVQHLLIREALIVEDGESRPVYTVLTPSDEGYDLHFYSQRPDTPDEWIHHAEAVLNRNIEAASIAPVDITALTSAFPQHSDHAQHYADLAALGLPFGESLRGVDVVWWGVGESVGRVIAPASLHGEQGRYRAHPALLDACLQPLAEALPQGETSQVYTPLGFDHVQFFAPLPAEVWSHVQLADLADSHSPRETYTARVTLYDAVGRVLALFEGVRLKRAHSGLLQRASAEGWRDWLYTLAWETVPQVAPLPHPYDLLGFAESTLATNEALQRYAALRPLLNNLSRDYILYAFSQLGFTPQVDDLLEAHTLQAALKVRPAYGRLLWRLLDMLAEDGLLQAESAEVWRVITAWPVLTATDLQAGQAELLANFPEFDAELQLVAACGPALAQVLNGTADPLALLFPGGDLTQTERLYQESPVARHYNGIVQAVIQALVAATPDRPLRILEIGAGTGGTTGFILPLLPPDRTHYVFTDISPLFSTKARQKFAAYPFVEYGVLNIEQDPITQGFDAGGYDLIVAANVIHATADLEQTLAHVQRLLTAGGQLLLLEMTYAERWIDLTFGLTDGWWLFDDTLRKNYLLLTATEWREALMVQGFESVAVLPPPETAVAEQSVIVAQLPVAQVAAGNWIIFEDGDLSPEIVHAIEAGGGQVASIPAFGDRGGILAALEGLPMLQWAGVLYLRGLTIQDLAFPEALATGIEDALAVTQALAEWSQLEKPPLWVVMSTDTDGTLSQALLQGLVKTLNREHPELQAMSLSLDLAALDIPTLLTLLRQSNAEDHLLLQGTTLQAARLSPYALESQVVNPQQTLALHVGTVGLLDSLAFVPVAPRSLGPDEVEIRVRATGLNFKDVLNAMGMYPGEATPLGGECAGEVIRVGDAVRGLEAGDAVIALTNGAFSTRITVPAAQVFHKPENLSFAEAATVAIPFITAYFTLIYLGRLEAGQRVLIHAASGGVGLAAVQLAGQLGAEVFATAGSDTKRDYLLGLGVPHVLDSRSLAFADAIPTLTEGQGVDVVLNSLADDFCAASLSVLGEGGRFLEIGKRGILAPEWVEEHRPDVAYHIVDWTATLHETPDLIRRIMGEITQLLAEEIIQPLPLEAFATSAVIDAFRYMAMAKHIGKIAVTYPAAGVQVDASYLVTGGLGGLGLLTAQWLVAQGAGAIILMGRRAPDEATQNIIDGLRAAGVLVMVALGDVSDELMLKEVLAEAAESLPPLRGVFHAAGVLDNGALANLTWPRFETVMKAKVYGAWLLHQLTRHLPLDYFVLYSSIASVFGAAGQANHAAANSYMDALARQRYQQGLPALSINWGAWAEVGAVLDHDSLAHLDAQGVETMSPKAAMAALSAILDDLNPQVVVTAMQWPLFLKDKAARPFYSWLAQAEMPQSPTALISPAASPQTGNSPALMEALEAATPARREALTLAFVLQQAARVLDLPEDSVREDVPFSDYGLDSLMAVELRNLIGAGLGLKRALPATLVFDYPTASALNTYLLQDVLQFVETTAQRSEVTQPETSVKLDSLAHMEDLSDDEVDQLFAELGLSDDDE